MSPKYYYWVVDRGYHNGNINNLYVYVFEIPQIINFKRRKSREELRERREDKKKDRNRAEIKKSYTAEELLSLLHNEITYLSKNKRLGRFNRITSGELDNYNDIYKVIYKLQLKMCDYGETYEIKNIEEKMLNCIKDMHSMERLAKYMLHI